MKISIIEKCLFQMRIKTHQKEYRPRKIMLYHSPFLIREQEINAAFLEELFWHYYAQVVV